MRILGLEPYYGGSHKAFLDGWSSVGMHDWTLLTLAAYKWKWRMRHAAISFAEQIRGRVADGERWDLIFCSDMLNLAEFKGLAPKSVRDLPAIAYFHENQLTYPVRFESERDYQFAMTNFTTALAAERVWFNSAFHRDSFLEALTVFLKRMPDCQPVEGVEDIRRKSQVQPPGIGEFAMPSNRRQGPLRILWAARWEHDKGPEEFFEALRMLKRSGTEFRVSIIGEQFRDRPGVFESARKEFAAHIERWGYQQSRVEFEAALAESDVIVSTAQHEFFGITVVEAIAAGAYPLLPRRLAYPELLGLNESAHMAEFFYDGSVAALVDKLVLAAGRAASGTLQNRQKKAARMVERFKWNKLAPLLDRAVEDVHQSAVKGR